MPRTGRPKPPLALTADERSTLQRFVRRGNTSQKLSLRARIILMCETEPSNDNVASELGVTSHTVGKWRTRFLAGRLNGLLDAPRCGAPRKIGDDQVEKIIVDTLESMPKGASRWSTRAMAEKAGVSRESVSRIWRAFGLKPHRRSTFQLSKDPQFIEKVRDVVGLYMTPPDNAIVLSVDEKSQIQALNRTQALLPMRPHQVEMGTPEYERHGTTTLFAALDVATGGVIGKCFQRHRTREFIKFLEIIDQTVPPGLEVHLILDNYATHKTPQVRTWLVRHKRFHVHFIPTHSSWLNEVECWFSILTAKQLKRGSHNSVKALEAAIYAFLEAHNEKARPFRWTKTADVILAKVARYCATTIRLHAKRT